MNLHQQLNHLREGRTQVKVYLASYDTPIVGVIKTVQSGFLTMEMISPMGIKSIDIIPLHSLRRITVHIEVAK